MSGREFLEGVDFQSVCPGISDEVWDPVLAGKGSATCEIQMGDRWFSFTLSHEPGTEHLFVFGTDISELKEAERELEERAPIPPDESRPRGPPGPRGGGAACQSGRQRPVRKGLPPRRVLAPTVSRSGGRGLAQGFSRAATPSNTKPSSATAASSFTLCHEPIGDHVFVYGTDVTELKVAQRSLSELARFPDMNPGPVLRLDREGYVLLANPAARRVFGGKISLAGRGSSCALDSTSKRGMR